MTLEVKGEFIAHTSSSLDFDMRQNRRGQQLKYTVNSTEEQCTTLA